MTSSSPTVSLVALRDHREKLIGILSECFAQNVLDMDEFETRLTRAHEARSIAELEGLVADLAPYSEKVSSHAALLPLKVDSTLRVAPKGISATFGNVERSGGWEVPAQLAVKATFGNVELDFRDARFSASVVDVDARAVFGNVEFIVPPHLAVQCEGSTLFGNIESRGNAGADPERPLLRITGKATFGNIEIRTALPGSSVQVLHGRHKR